MSLVALALVITGAMLHAYWNVQAKKASGGVPFIWLFGLVSVVLMLPLAAWRLAGSWSAIDANFVIAVVASAVIHVLYSYALQRGYRSGDFSVVYPVARGVAPMMTVAGAALLLAEATPLLNWLGAGAIATGIILLGWQRGRGLSSMRGGIGWACLTGATISAYTLVDGWAIAKLHADPVTYYALGLLLRSILFAPVALRDRPALRESMRKSLPQIAAVGICAPIAYLLILLALQHAPVGQVAPLREISMLFGVFVGGSHLGERIGGSKLVGVILLGLGALLVAIA
jgi:drug/metabolite transporter (DMT)-like permease